MLMLASKIMVACRSLCFTSCGIFLLCTLPNNITHVCPLSRDFPSLLQVQAAKLTPSPFHYCRLPVVACFVLFFFSSIISFHAFKCNLKELTTKSTLIAWGQRSLACACPVAGYIDHMIHWRFQFSFVLGSVSHFPPLSPSPLGFVGFFLPLMFFSVTGACPLHFLWGLMAGLCCCASHGGIISI